MATLKKLQSKEIIKTAVVVSLIPILLAGFWFGLPAALNTKMFPVFTVISGSMCIPQGECDTFSHAFEKTLHIGDLIVIQGVNARDLKTEYPNSDIIVFRNPKIAANDAHANIVHRIIDVVEVDGTLYFHTKGDGNGYPNVWPQIPTAYNRDFWQSPDDPNGTYNGAISEEYVYGKVVMRIPWLGTLAILSQQYSVIPIILGVLIILLVVFEFILPFMKKKTDVKQAT
ncbi:MAG: hypothetical protein FWE56_03365, partial [Candidatus Bathyarchaeota archaeon]|nr:hypothetical protein [Candidatus Termiticorpusculum sp.]MCL2868293.1 hypothetical protein [Candidatus Termiticorpusculum sp.]